jgi:hypothetical protein
MINPFTLTLQASDVLGVQNAYLFLILGKSRIPLRYVLRALPELKEM